MQIKQNTSERMKKLCRLREDIISYMTLFPRAIRMSERIQYISMKLRVCFLAHTSFKLFNN